MHVKILNFLLMKEFVSESKNSRKIEELSAKELFTDVKYICKLKCMLKNLCMEDVSQT